VIRKGRREGEKEGRLKYRPNRPRLARFIKQNLKTMRSKLRSRMLIAGIYLRKSS
jgi:hypothetical protein